MERGRRTKAQKTMDMMKVRKDEIDGGIGHISSATPSQLTRIDRKPTRSNYKNRRIAMDMKESLKKLEDMRDQWESEKDELERRENPLQGSVMCGECMDKVSQKKIRMCLDCCKLSDIPKTSRLICASCCLEGSHAGHTTLLHSVVQNEFRKISEETDSLNEKRQSCKLLATYFVRASAETLELFCVSDGTSGQSLSEIKKVSSKLREEEKQKLTITMNMMKKFLLLSLEFHDKFGTIMTSSNVTEDLMRETTQISDIMSEAEQTLKRLVVFTQKPQDDISGPTFSVIFVSPEETVRSLCRKLEEKHNLTDIRNTVHVTTEDGERLTTGTMASNGVKDMAVLTLSRICRVQAYACLNNRAIAEQKAELEKRGSTAEPRRVEIVQLQE